MIQRLFYIAHFAITMNEIAITIYISGRSLFVLVLQDFFSLLQFHFFA
uniref:Uncharacterized protein n=1 Tax=Arundo donax TaxID=35708 RepID=A0A0A9DLU8_ARUDO